MLVCITLYLYNSSVLIAERLSARLMIAHWTLAMVIIIIYNYIYIIYIYIIIYVCNASAHALRMRRIIIIIITCISVQWVAMVFLVYREGMQLPFCNGSARGICVDAYI